MTLLMKGREGMSDNPNIVDMQPLDDDDDALLSLIREEMAENGEQVGEQGDSFKAWCARGGQPEGEGDVKASFDIPLELTADGTVDAHGHAHAPGGSLAGGSKEPEPTA
jgi:hypothetical protein